MSSDRSISHFVEINAFSALHVEAEVNERETTVREVRETFFAGATNPAGTEFPSEAPTSVACALRPSSCRFHLATAEEARRFITADAIRDHLEGMVNDGMCSWTHVLGSAGESPLGAGGRSGRWLSASSPTEAVETTRSRLAEIGVRAEKMGSAAIAYTAACRRLLKVSGQAGPVLVFDLGRAASSCFMVNSDGVFAAREVPIGFDDVADAVAAGVNLRLRGAAAKLFFNPRYDFSEAALGIGAQIAEQLKKHLAELETEAKRAPAAIVCTGLPVAQSWFGHALAEGLGIEPWRPSVRAWLDRAGVKFAETQRETVLPPEWVGVLGLVEASVRGVSIEGSPWIETPSRESVTPNPAPADTEENGGEAKEAVEASKAPEPKHTERERKAHRRSVPAFPRPLDADRSIVSRAKAKSQNSRTASSDTKVSTEEGAPPPVERSQVESVAEAANGDPAPKKPASRRKTIVGWLSLAAVVAVVSTMGYFYFQQVEKEKRAIAAEKVEAEKRAAADAKALQLAEKRASEEAEARRKAEAAAAEEVARAREAQKLAEAAAAKREQEAMRLLQATGSVEIVTEPAGATVAVGNYAPRRTPAKIEDLHLGTYPTLVSLEGYDPVSLTIQVEDGQTTRPEVIHLVKQVGSVSVESQPMGVPFDVRPADARAFVASTETRQGVTPATVDDLEPGDYVVTLLRSGWPRYSETVSVSNHGAATVRREFDGASLHVSSTPSGASVALNGTPIGETPLDINDVAPGSLELSFEYDDFLPLRVEKEAAAGEQLIVDVEMTSRDKVARLNELDERPQAIHVVEPDLSRTTGKVGERVVVSLDVNLAGVPENISVDEAPDAETGQRCIDAAKDWRFTPGVIDGKAVRTRVSIPFVIR